jgi:hypothetical protein
MIQSRELFSTNLEYALLANRVLSALAMKDIDQDERRQALDEATQFLEIMLKAEDFGRSLQISDDSYKSALAYSEGIQALRFSIPHAADADNPDLNQLVNQLLVTAKKLHEGQGVADEEQDQLALFFRSVRDSSLESGGLVIEKVAVKIV